METSTNPKCARCGSFKASHKDDLRCWDWGTGDWSTQKFKAVEISEHAQCPCNIYETCNVCRKPPIPKLEDGSFCKTCGPTDCTCGPTKPEPAMFAQRASATLERCRAIFAERGTQYGDTWKDCQFLALKAVAKDLHISITDEQCRALALAMFVDVKYIRLLGGYKDDSIVDGINYAAALAEEMKRIKG